MQSLSGKRVFITGASGFVGSNLIKRLLKEDAIIYALTRKNNSSNLSEFKNNIIIKRGDITDFSFIYNTLNHIRPKIIFHTAGHLNRDLSPETLKNSFEVNFNGTLNILRSINELNIKRFIFLSTSEGYKGAVPFSEKQERIPLSPYSSSKICAEVLCKMFFNIYKIPIVILRPFLIYGPRQNKGMLISDLILSLLDNSPVATTKGEQTRDFVYIDDFIESLVLASKNNNAIGQTFNVCSGSEYRIKELITIITKKIDSISKPEIGKLKYRENEIWRHFGDNTKIRKFLGWKPNVSIEQGIEKTIEWYRKNKIVN